ncbi:MAG: histidine phosphatase family protein [Streptococcus sp.]
MRHGQRLLTHSIESGWCDSPLTEKGRDQARQVRAYLKNMV